MDEHLEDLSHDHRTGLSSDVGRDMGLDTKLTSDLEADILEEVKIEEVGIDGMCGVY